MRTTQRDATPVKPIKPIFSVYEVVPTEPNTPDNAQHKPSAPIPRLIVSESGSLTPEAYETE